MKIGDRIFVRGYIDEIRKDTVIVRNDGGYFGTIPSEVITGELPSAQPEKRTDERTETHACDLISRQALCEYALNQKDKIITANDIMRFPSAQPEQRWIPCSERLPSKADHTDDMVLVCYRNGSVRFNTCINGWVQGNPVAWMPLPEPAKEDDYETD